VLELASEGITTGRGKRMAYLHRDRVNGVLRPRRGARLAAVTSGGAIAEVGDYRVILDPDDTPVGTVNEDFAIESMVGDVFLLGTHSWRIRRVTQGEVRVVDAEGAHPTIPFWVGEAPSRTGSSPKRSRALRRTVGDLLTGAPRHRTAAGGPPDDARRQAASQHVAEACGLEPSDARQLVDYLAAALGELGVLPTDDDIVFERFFDEAGGMQMVVHAPLGGRINKGSRSGPAQEILRHLRLRAPGGGQRRRRSCSRSDPSTASPSTARPRLLRSDTAPAALEQAVLASPMFTSRWRWNLNRSLAVLRFRGGRRKTRCPSSAWSPTI
jgi:ATP-dependent Lhr-like helicase